MTSTEELERLVRENNRSDPTWNGLDYQMACELIAARKVVEAAREVVDNYYKEPVFIEGVAALDLELTSYYATTEVGE